MKKINQILVFVFTVTVIGALGSLGIAEEEIAGEVITAEIITGIVGSMDFDNDIDVFEVKCKGPTIQICADVNPRNVPDVMGVEVVVTKPKRIKGFGTKQTNPVNGVSADACATRHTFPKGGAMTAFVIFDEEGSTSFTYEYSSFIECVDGTKISVKQII
jgi:hypothetical protein